MPEGRRRAGVATFPRISNGGDHLQMMRGWRHELFGEVAQGLKAGKLAIGIRDGKPDIFSA